MDDFPYYSNISFFLKPMPYFFFFFFFFFFLQTWGGAKNGFGLARCCQDLSLDGFPPTATSVYFEYQPLDDEVI